MSMPQKSPFLQLQALNLTWLVGVLFSPVIYPVLCHVHSPLCLLLDAHFFCFRHAKERKVWSKSQKYVGIKSVICDTN